MNAVYLGVLWIVYYALHSAMAHPWFKSWLAKRVRFLFPYYRLFYSFLAAVNFILLFYLHWIAPSKLIYDPQSNWLAAGFLLSGMIVFFISSKAYGMTFLYKDSETQPLKTDGINGFVRHPLYSGILLLLIGFFLWFPFWKNLVFLVVSVIYIIIGSLLEEEKLITRYGEEYLRYRTEVKMLIPYLF
jgi:protein-S-isoprenylcysteine O-methyltransferase Ste14